jgi:hypothetical protein
VRREIDWTEVAFWTVVATIFIPVILILVLYVPAGLRNSARCLANGYATSDTTWNLKGYCISADLINVVPVNEVGK